MNGTRAKTIKRLLFALLAATAFTFAAMLIFAGILTAVQISDKAISFINQLVKIAAVSIGTAAAVPRGGEKGFITGAVVALFYMCAGYICYLTLGGAEFSFLGLLGELLLCCAAGAVCGAVRANLNPKRRKRVKVAS